MINKILRRIFLAIFWALGYIEERPVLLYICSALLLALIGTAFVGFLLVLLSIPLAFQP